MNIFQQITKEEGIIRKRNEEEYLQILNYYKKVIQVYYQVINNSIQVLHRDEKDLKESIFILQYISGIRIISLSKSAIDLALNGHPFEALSINRMLLEISLILQYLSLHPNEIEGYYLGKVKPTQIRKQINWEKQIKITGRLYGLLSTYSHASSELLLSIAEQNGIDADPLYILNDKVKIKSALFGTVEQVIGHYFAYRIAFRKKGLANKEINESDNYLFNTTRMQKYFPNTKIKTIKKMAKFIIGDDKAKTPNTRLRRTGQGSGVK